MRISLLVRSTLACFLVLSATAGIGSSIDRARRVAIAYVAYTQISPQDRKKILVVLRSHPCYTLWGDLSRGTSVPPDAPPETPTFLYASLSDLTSSSIAAQSVASEVPTGKPLMRLPNSCEATAVKALQTPRAAALMRSQFGMPTVGTAPIAAEIILLQHLLQSKADRDLKAVALVRLLQAISDAHQYAISCASEGRASSDDTQTPSAISQPMSEGDGISEGGVSGDIREGIQLAHSAMDRDLPGEKQDLTPTDWVQESSELSMPRKECDSSDLYPTRIGVAGIRVAEILHQLASTWQDE